MSCFAKRMSFFVESNVIGGIFGRFCPAIDVNQRIHIPVFQQFISGDVVMCGVQTDIFGGKTKSIASEIINCIEEVFAVMPAGTGEIHQQGEFHFQLVVPGAEHIERMPEIPDFVITVPSPFGIGVRVVAGTAAAVWAGVSAGRKMPAERGGMGNYGGTIAGQCKVSWVNQAKPDGWKDCKDGKNLLQSLFRIIRGRLSFHNMINDIPGSKRACVFRLLQFPIGSDDLFGFFPVFASRKQGGAGIKFPLAKPETVHKIIVRTKRWQFFGGSTANEEGQGRRFWKCIPDPGGKTCACFGFIEKQGKKDERAEDLRLVLSRTSAIGIEGGDVFGKRVKVEV